MSRSASDALQPDVSVGLAEVIANDVYGIDATASPLSGDRDRSFLLDSAAESYVLKVENKDAHPEALHAQAAAIEWALEADPGLPLAKLVRTLQGELIGHNSGYRLQLTKHVQGVSPRQFTVSPGFRRNLGRFTARLALALAGYDAPILRRPFTWNLTQLSDQRPLVEYQADHRDLIERELDHFETVIGPTLRRLSSQAIHGDLNPDNMVADSADPERLAGVFDFGDLCSAPAIVDLAIATAYQCAGFDPVPVMTQMAAAYHVEKPLSEPELYLLPDLVAARCAQSLLVSAHKLRSEPDNAVYAANDVENMAGVLAALNETKRRDSVESLVRSCGFSGSGSATGDPLSLRRAHMAATYTLSYSEPIHAESAEGVWITDTEGRRFLDAYNNVPHVGHGHPRVLSALWSQSRRLNTNTRYLTNEVGDYAKRLADLLPDPLSVVFFTNSGSEANDLAYRLATSYSGAKGAVTSLNGYHGATTTTAALSPQEHDVSTFGDWSVSVDLVDFAEGERQLSRLTDQDIAMVIVDTIFSSEGIWAALPDMLVSVKEWVNGEGGLLVADEVQAGFGRVGSQFWGFGDVTPDIVTLGKPIGNGYPMGAVVTSQEIADRFDATSVFFSTFAGSPVAAAIGTAVLDVIEDEDLASHADEVGAYIRNRVVALGHRSVADVRGAGLFSGVEMDSEDAAIAVVEEMRRRGVLVGRTGPRGDVLKIRPPLVFQAHHADFLIEQLSGAFDQLPA